MMGACGEIKQLDCYASLAIYSGRNREEEISEALRVSPSLVGERKGIFSWIYSTQNEPHCRTIEQHLRFLKRRIGSGKQELVRFEEEGCEIRIWVYFGIEEMNGSFVLEPNFLAWLSSFGADICVDVWAKVDDDN